MSERTLLQSMSRRHVLSLPPAASVHDAACAMTRANCGSVLIIDNAGTMLGILTERDLMTRVLAKGLDAPFSCREGHCGACACTLRSGKVNMEVNDVLEQDDLDDGLILACQSHPESDSVEVTYDE